MAAYIYMLSDGALYSTCPSSNDPIAPAATLAANGMGVFYGPALSPTVGWSPGLKTTIVTVATTPITAPPVTGTLVFNGVTYVVAGTTQ